MSKIGAVCGIWKEIVFLLLGATLSFLVTTFTTWMNNSHEERMQNSRNAFSFLQEYNKNYLRIINCKKQIIDKVKILGRNLNIQANSLEASNALANYSQIFDTCNSDLLKMKLISTVVGLSTSGINFTMNSLSELNNHIITTRERIVYENSQINFHSELGYELQEFPNIWGKCLKEINNDFLRFCKNFLINKRE